MKKTIEAQIGELVNSWIKDIKRDSVRYSEIEWIKNQFTIHGDNYSLIISFEYNEVTVEDEQIGDWYTPTFPAIKEYNITEIFASIVGEDGIERKIPMFSKIKQLAELVLNQIINE